jgi:hypothetical protein
MSLVTFPVSLRYMGQIYWVVFEIKKTKVFQDIMADVKPLFDVLNLTDKFKECHLHFIEVPAVKSTSEVHTLMYRVWNDRKQKWGPQIPFFESDIQFLNVHDVDFFQGGLPPVNRDWRHKLDAGIAPSPVFLSSFRQRMLTTLQNSGLLTNVGGSSHNCFTERWDKAKYGYIDPRAEIASFGFLNYLGEGNADYRRNGVHFLNAIRNSLSLRLVSNWSLVYKLLNQLPWDPRATSFSRKGLNVLRYLTFGGAVCHKENIIAIPGAEFFRVNNLNSKEKVYRYFVGPNFNNRLFGFTNYYSPEGYEETVPLLKLRFRSAKDLLQHVEKAVGGFQTATDSALVKSVVELKNLYQTKQVGNTSFFLGYLKALSPAELAAWFRHACFSSKHKLCLPPPPTAYLSEEGYEKLASKASFDISLVVDDEQLAKLESC